MPEQTPLVLIGESNPYGTDPKFALYPLPPHASGGRLQRVIMGIRRSRYVDLPRYNLCEGPWRVSDARVAAHQIVAEWRDRPGPDPAFVLLGRKVAHAFGCSDVRPFDWASWPYPDDADTRFLLLPHPSGLNRQWHEPGAIETARERLRSLRPDIPWGEVEP